LASRGDKLRFLALGGEDNHRTGCGELTRHAKSTNFLIMSPRKLLYFFPIETQALPVIYMLQFDAASRAIAARLLAFFKNFGFLFDTLTRLK